LRLRREGLALSSRYKISDNYAQGNITFDMSRQYYPPFVIGFQSWSRNRGMGGGGYQDECTSFPWIQSIYQDYGSSSWFGTKLSWSSCNFAL
jgi:LPS-assembly protein